MPSSFRLILAFIAVAWGAIHVVAQERGAAPDEIVVGFLLPPDQPSAESLRDGALLGVDLANRCQGARARLVVRGRAGAWGSDAVEAARMVSDDGAAALIAPPDGAASHLILQVSGRTRVPVASLCPDSSIGAAGVPWVARMVPQTVDEAAALFEGVAADRWVAVLPDGRAGREAGRDLAAGAARCGRRIANAAPLPAGATNLARLARRVLADRPDAVLLWLEPSVAGDLAKALRTAGFSGVLAGPGRLRTPQFTARAGEGDAGLITADPGRAGPEAAGAEPLTGEFRARFGRPPEPLALAAGEAAMMLVRLLRSSREPATSADFPLRFAAAGAPDRIEFDQRGDRLATLRLVGTHPARSAPPLTP